MDTIEANTEFSQAPSPGRTLAQLIDEYRTDKVSGFSKLRYHTRMNHENILRRMRETFGHKLISEIRNRTLEEMYQTWSQDGTKLSIGHTFMSKLRTVCGYGAGMLEDMECNRICIALKQRRFDASEKAKETFLTADQATAIRETARRAGFFSIALAQALQFDCLLRQKDCIGEWVPATEPGQSLILDGGKKWLRGITWEEIDDDLALKHVTSKKLKKLILPLREAPMVMEEFRHVPDWLHDQGGPLVICEATSLPWDAGQFRRRWRQIADLCGIPPEVKNMDSRSGGISEGTDARVPLEYMRHAATHSDIAMTQRYDRNSGHKAAESLRQRVEYRKARMNNEKETGRD